MAAAGSSEMAVKSYYVRAVTSMSGKLSVHYKELSAAHSRMEEQIQQIYRHTSLPQLQRYITGLLEEYAGGIIRDDMDVLMKRMVDLIHRHYDENLKLETLADVFTYSSAYLGKLFKNTMGCSFNTYLDTIRIEKAKELLDQGCKIHQAASSVGFSDVDYFREKFKKNRRHFPLRLPEKGAGGCFFRKRLRKGLISPCLHLNLRVFPGLAADYDKAISKEGHK
ncbi:helix-turn-helix transcriptional regulator [Paenibacillus rhizoplanae]|uniref:helix-turn-helix transcriptional regulator n=1 Tax=Paenibacillus rhizoplanae TaxID=1917181 RepID=UPI00361231BB